MLDIARVNSGYKHVHTMLKKKRDIQISEKKSDSVQKLNLRQEPVDIDFVQELYLVKCS
jgi:hypothetical protein